MTIKEQLLQSLERVLDGNPWYGNSIISALDKITAENMGHAVQTVNGKSVPEYLLHMISCQDFVLEKLRGNKSLDIELGSEQDWPKNNSPSDDSWSKLIIQFKNQNSQILNEVKSRSESDFDQLVPGKSYTLSLMIEGLIHHNIYHLGQIVILSKLLENR